MTTDWPGTILLERPCSYSLPNVSRTPAIPMDGGANLKYGERDVNFDRVYPFNSKKDP